MTSAAARSFTARLGLELPIVQAPMAGFHGVALAAAAAGAGALASLPGAALSPQALRDAVGELRRSGSAPVNLNFFCHVVPAPDPAREAAWRAALRPYYEELGVPESAIQNGPGRLPFGEEALVAVEDLRPEVVSFHFGLPPAPLLERVRATGAQVWSSATTVAEAQWLAAHGVDAVVAQGAEAGGHRGVFLDFGPGYDLSTQLRTLPLLTSILEVVRVPVIAAGGISTADGVAEALRLGASAVQLGTVFLLCPEATTSAVHRAALRSEAARDTALTNLFSGRPARGIVNRLMRELGPMSALPPAFPSAVNAIAPLRAAAEQAGSGDFSPLWAGQDVSGCRAMPAAQLIRELAAKL
ncbi:MAG TPA: nitronate monooxygenase family protein [Burkholderiaceae bacterium]